MIGLGGMRVALLEARRSGELASLVRHFGGEPYCVPAVREQRRAAAEEVLTLLERLDREPRCVIVLSTGVGATALFNEARRLGRLTELKQAFNRATIVCRGPKPIAALKQEGLEPSIRAKEPYTTAELLTALSPLLLERQFVVVLHYGERNVALVDALWGRCTGLQELLLYDWSLPEDTAPLHDLVRELIGGRVGAIAFTSQVQARHLFQIASQAAAISDLLSALRCHTVVAAVGPTCASALRSFGVQPQVVPAHPKMGAMIEHLARYASERRGVA